MSQVFSTIFCLKKPNTLKIGFFKSKYGGGRLETSMHKRAFQALKRTLMKVSDLPPSYFDLKKLIIYKLVFYQNMVGEDLIHA